MPDKKFRNKKIVLIHGQHAAIERYYSMCEFLNDYGEVIMPDLPGFGGMSSFYQIGLKPSYDNYADYLYTFLKTQELTEDIWLVGNSFGAQCMTRMLQKYPDSQAWIRQPIAVAGFAAGSNFHVSNKFRFLLFPLIYVGQTRLGSSLIKLVAFNRFSLNLMINVFSRFKAKMQNDDQNLKSDMMAMEKYLWSVNDKRTHAKTAIMMFRYDLTRYSSKKIKHKLHNLITDHDQYFDNQSVEESFRKLYLGYETSLLNLKIHNPSMIADKQAVSELLSEEVKELLAGV